MGWGQRKNGELLALVETEFDVFGTTDQNLSHQQNLARRKIAILVLSTNRWPRVRSQAARIAAAFADLKPGECHEIVL